MIECKRIFYIVVFVNLVHSNRIFSQTMNMFKQGIVQLHGSMNLSFGYLREDQFNRELYYSAFGANSNTVVNGVPFTLNWNLVMAEDGKLRSGKFSIGFTKEGLENYLLQGKEKKLISSVVDSKLDSINRKVNDLDYLNKVSDSKHELNNYSSFLGTISRNINAVKSKLKKKNLFLRVTSGTIT